MTTRADHVDDLTAEIVSGLDLVPIPATRPAVRPRQRGGAHGDLATVAVFVLVGLITLTIATPYTRGVLAEGLRQLERILGGRSSATSLPLGTSLAGVRLGMTTDDVFRALGTPSRRGDQGEAWIYDRGIIVLFSSSEAREPSPHVQRVVAWSGSGARTEEGFSLDECRPGKTFDPSAPGCGYAEIRRPEAFRERYRAFEIEAWTNGIATRFEPFTILSVRGIAPDGTAVVLRASFGPAAERVDLSFSRAGPPGPGDLLPWQNYRIDPFFISACELLARAEVSAGYGEGWGSSNEKHRSAPEGGARVCSVRNDDTGDPHLLWHPRGGQPHEVDRLLNDLGVGVPVNWRSTGTGRWRSDGFVQPMAPSSPAPSPRATAMVAVYLEPYFYVIWADPDLVERLADAVRAELTRP
jgi:hypothetical protein